jgi:uncharacterized membrane protein
VIQWLRRRLIAGVLVTVPLLITVYALVWILGIIDGFAAPITERVLGRDVPGLGLLISLIVVLSAGVVATNVLGRRLLARTEAWLTRIPVFRTIYTPVKQLVVAFSPDTEHGFKRVVMVEDPNHGWILGFLTKEFRVERDTGPEMLVAVYIPTNHLYLGDIRMYPRERAIFPDISVEEGIRIVLTGGMSMPGRIGGK